MTKNVARRSMLKTLGGAAALGSAACQKNVSTRTATPVPPTVLPRVNLICHGMMLLWQDRMNPTSGIKIYAPDAMGMHIVSLTTELGGGSSLFPMPGTYTLAFSCNNARALGPRDKTKNLVLYDSNSTKGLVVNQMNAQYILNVPYPSEIRPFRIMKFGSKPPYKRSGPLSTTTNTFDIKPGQMAGLSVLTYNNVSSAVTLAQGASAPKTIEASPLLLNLHFYATTNPAITPSPSHLQFFNALLGFTGQPTLDLAVDNASPSVTPPQNEQVDGDLSQLDVYDLVELKPGGRGADPVGCIVGWGS